MPHILVIEDDAGLRETFELILENEGYQVSLSASIFEDAADVERLHPDLILLDVWVEGMNDGFTMLQMLRSSPRTSSLPVVFCTVAAHPKIHEKVEALREQGLPVVYKPFDLQDLLRAVRKSLALDKEQIAPGS
jgi:CheY-like chemotaxis protein